ncbi:hypothetical protein P7D98_23260, partial [Enterococcus avium]|nr:hypothetical protein [Enterococcus avium]MDT2468551.1 hypothetical protein [Enterococcus avium]MDT2507968.1 hypothetical protein [Enterococcus avium]
RKEAGFELVRHTFEYQSIKELHETKSYPINTMCTLLHVTRSAYYRWLKNPKLPEVLFNEQLADLVRYIYEADNDKGYRRIC